jgi:hypothetical protein
VVSDLVPDLLAAIDETERIAQAATDGPWLAVGRRVAGPEVAITAGMVNGCRLPASTAGGEA